MLEKFEEALKNWLSRGEDSDRTALNREFINVLLTEHASLPILEMIKKGYDKTFLLPEIGAMAGVGQNHFHKDDVLMHTLEVLDRTSPNPITRLGALMHDISKPVTKSVKEDGRIQFIGHEVVGAHFAEDRLTELGFEHTVVQGVSTLVRLHMDCHRVDSDKALRKWVNKAGPYLDNLLDLCAADSSSHHPDHVDPERIPNIRRRVNALSSVPAKQDIITGADLKPFFKPCAKYKDLLEYAQHVATPSSNKEQVLNAVIDYGKRMHYEPNDSYNPSKKKKVKILRGVPGSGKSHYTNDFKDAIVVSADTYFMVNGGYNFNKSKLGEAHKDCLKRFIAYIITFKFDGGLIIVDNTNITVAEIAPYYQIAAAYGWDVEIITFNAPVDLCIKRNVHNVSEEAIKQRHRLMETEENRFPKQWKNTVKIVVEPNVVEFQKKIEEIQLAKRSCTCQQEDITPHTCPYSEEIGGDSRLCKCCSYCTRGCAMDI